MKIDFLLPFEKVENITVLMLTAGFNLINVI